jgi:glycine hydroxymethyltransferase
MFKTDSVSLTGKEAEIILEEAGITTNKNMIPGDKRSPFITSGIRLGTPAITTRGLKEEHMVMISDWINSALRKLKDPKSIKKEVLALCKDYPVYPGFKI